MSLKQLSLDVINTVIDSILYKSISTKSKLGVKIRRVDNLVFVRDFISSFQSVDITKLKDADDDVVIPIYIIIESELESGTAGQYEMCGASMFSLGYSTWKGRVMNLDLFIAEQHGDLFLQTLAQIAKQLDCARIVHLNNDEQKAKHFREDHGAEVLMDWLTLQMGSDEIKSFIATRNEWAGQCKDRFEKKFPPIRTEATDEKFVSTSSVEMAMNDTLLKMNFLLTEKKVSKAISLRVASQDDAQNIFDLVNGLAVYENAADEVAVSPSVYKRDGCGTEYPIFHTILAESRKDEENNHPATDVVGMGFFYFGYSATMGKYLYLEDLFIQESSRGHGYGKSIMYSLADIALSLNCDSFVWQALDWNAPALAFYKSIGAKICDLKTIRLDQEMIDKLNA